jgi:integrase/recombinase XerC
MVTDNTEKVPFREGKQLSQTEIFSGADSRKTPQNDDTESIANAVETPSSRTKSPKIVARAGRARLLKNMTEATLATETKEKKVGSTMAKGATTVTFTLGWEEVIRDFLLHVQATRALNTVGFYRCQLRTLVTWAEANDVALEQFGKRHLDRYLVDRAQSVNPTTLRHHAVACKAFFKWCARNDYLTQSPIADYEIRRAPKPARFMPTDDDIRTMLKALMDYWNPNQHSDIRYVPHAKRLFHRDRNYAIMLGLLDTACRVGEITNLKVGDVKLKEREILIRESKGKEPRVVPISPDWIQALNIWLRIREKSVANVPSQEDEGWLFINEYGEKVDSSHFLKTLKRVLRYAKVSDEMTLHSLRRYSLNRMAKVNLLATQLIAGHKEPKTTLLYTKLDADFVREVHTSVSTVGNILNSKREIRRKRIL